MGRAKGYVAGLQLVSGEEHALIACPAELIPDTGQYLMAAEKGAVQATPLFLASYQDKGFLTPKPYPPIWKPGTDLTLFGPLGHGFRLPADAQRLVFVAFGDSISRLLPLVTGLKSTNSSLTLFSDVRASDLPPAVEAYPMEDLPEYFDWADFFVVDSPLLRLEELAQIFNVFPNQLNGLRGQVLVHTGMPCDGIGKCGVCAVRVNRTWELACEVGPVFDLSAVLKGMIE
jgi:hypothetical protein